MSNADWTELPSELLNLITDLLNNSELDIIRIRSVCSTWRSSVSNHSHISPFKFPQINLYHILSDLNKTNTPFSNLSKTSFFLIKPPHQQTLTRPWLIQIIKNSFGKTKFFHPIISSNSHSPFLGVLDFNEISAIHLATGFIVDNSELTFHINRHAYKEPKKVLAINFHGRKPLVLGIVKGLFPRHLIFRCRNEKWTLISGICTYGDICVYKGKFYAVDKSGRTVTVEPDSSVRLVDDPLIVGDRKLLVESEGELLLVNMYEYLWFTVVVFKLDEKSKKWVKLKSLGDRVLFLGNVYSFSASTSDLRVAKGNCVVFMDDTFLSSKNRSCGSSVYQLDRGRLLHQPEYFELFSPPEWIFKS